MAFPTSHSLKQCLCQIFNRVIFKRLECSLSCVRLIAAARCGWDFLIQLLGITVRQLTTGYDFEVRLGLIQIKRSHPSVFVKLKYCWQNNWKPRGCRAGGTSTLQKVVLLGSVVNLELYIFLFPVWISHLHEKRSFLCVWISIVWTT